MIVGDLVQLSSYGKKLKSTPDHDRLGFGIVIDIKHPHRPLLEVMWYGSGRPLLHHRRELKIVAKGGNG